MICVLRDENGVESGKPGSQAVLVDFKIVRASPELHRKPSLGTPRGGAHGTAEGIARTLILEKLWVATPGIAAAAAVVMVRDERAVRLGVRLHTKGTTTSERDGFFRG